MSPTAPLTAVAPAFVGIAHRIVWATVATVGPDSRPRTRILHPIWEWDGDPSHDNATADCRAELLFDDGVRGHVWDLLARAPEPLGYDPSVIEAWTGPTVDAFAVLRLRPHRLRVLPGTMLRGEGGSLRSWSDPDGPGNDGTGAMG